MFYTEEDRAAGIPEQELQSAALDGKHETTAWRVRKDGNRFMADVVLHAMRDEAGRLTGFGRVTRDITRRYELGLELEKTRESLAQAQKLEAVGKLTGGIAHDFNNLLTVMSGNLELLERQISSEGGRRMIVALHRASDRAAKLTQALLAFSRRQSLRPETVSANRLINEFSELLRRAVGDAAALDFALSPTLDPVQIDPAQFQSAVLNLVVNARDAIQKPGGKIVVRTENVVFDAQRPPPQDDIEPGHYAAIHVDDNGDGIPAKLLDRVFEPFFTTKEVGKGSGLGLAQVYGFIKQSGGYVHLESDPAAGTQVSLYLPRSAGRAEAEDITDQGASLPDRSDATRILIVEDDADIRDMVAAKLADMGYDTVLAPDGPSALDILKSGTTIDLLFSDVVMPNGLRGDELARRAQRLRPGLKILLTSGYPTADLEASHALREFSFLAKPYRAEDLARAIAERLTR
jgi:signal transduction histidine kinase